MSHLRLGAALAASCLALALATALPAAAQDYPRLGLYWSVHRDGRPLTLPGGAIDPVVAAQVSRYHLIIVDVDPFSPYRPDVLAELRRLRPGIRLLGYVTGHYIWPSLDRDSLNHYPTRFWRTIRDMDGFLYNTAGEQFGLSNTALMNVNLAKRNRAGSYVVAESLAVLFWDVVTRSGNWDGIFIDTFCDGILWAQTPTEVIDFARAGYANAADFDSGWRAGTDTLGARLRQLSGAAPVMVGNCGYATTKYAWFNGWMRENFPNLSGGTWYSNMVSPTGYLEDDRHFRAPTANFLFSATAFLGTPYASGNMQQVRYGLGSAALGDGYGVYGYVGRVTDMYPYWTWWYDEYAVDLATGRSSDLAQHTGWLGQPRAPWYQMIWVGSGPDAVSNPDLEADLSGWTSYFALPGSMTRDTTTAAQGSASLRVHVGAASTVDWHANIASVGALAASYGTTLSATFWAKASAPRTVPVLANDPAIGKGTRQYVAIDTTWRRYQVGLVIGDAGSFKLQFFLGHETGDVWLDDLHLQQGTTTIYRRDFDNGSVLVNPGPAALTVPLGAGYRRILGARDPSVNDGTAAPTITVPSRDARFVISTADSIPPAPINDATVRP